MNFKKPIDNAFENLTLDDLDKASFRSFINSKFRDLEDEYRDSLFSDERFWNKVFECGLIIDIMRMMTENERLERCINNEVFMAALKRLKQSNQAAFNMSMNQIVYGIDTKDVLAQDKFEFAHSAPMFWDAAEQMSEDVKLSFLTDLVLKQKEFDVSKFLIGDFMCGDSEKEKYLRAYVINEHLVFKGSIAFINKALKEMSPQDMNEKDYKSLVGRLDVAYIEIPPKFFNREFVKAFNTIKNPVEAIIKIHNVYKKNPQFAEQLMQERKKHLRALEPKTLDSVCELFFEDSAKNIKTHLWTIFNHIKNDKNYEKFLGAKSVEFYKQLEEFLNNGDAKGLFEYLDSANINYMEKIYDDLSRGREFAAGEIQRNLTDLDKSGAKVSEVQGVKVHSFTGQDFAFLIHAKGSIDDCSPEFVEKSFKIDENNPWVISTSLISERSLRTYMGARFMYGFSSFDPAAVDSITAFDNWSLNAPKAVKSSTVFTGNSKYAKDLRSFENFKQLSTNQMNEITIHTDAPGHGDSFAPDFIVVFKDSAQTIEEVLPQNVLDTAKQLNIDIVVIDADRYQERIDQMESHEDERLESHSHRYMES